MISAKKVLHNIPNQ